MSRSSPVHSQHDIRPEHLLPWPRCEPIHEIPDRICAVEASLEAIPTMPYEVRAERAATEAIALGEIDIVPFLFVFIPTPFSGAKVFYGNIAPAIAR